MRSCLTGASAPLTTGILATALELNLNRYRTAFGGIRSQTDRSSASHSPDIAIVIPVFHKGQLVAFSANTAHHLDIGAPTPELNIDIPDGHAEGMLLAGTKLYDKGLCNEALREDGEAGVWRPHEPDVRERAEAVESDIVADIRSPPWA